MENMTGKVWILGDDIDTDIIIPTEYLAMKTIDDMKQYAFSPLRPELAGQIQKGDIIAAEILAGNNDVAFLYLPCQFRTQGTETILFHIVNCFHGQILCGNNDIGINIIAKYQNLTCHIFHICYTSSSFRSCYPDRYPQSADCRIYSGDCCKSCESFSGYCVFIN